jgi:hypothetical protein
MKESMVNLLEKLNNKIDMLNKDVINIILIESNNTRTDLLMMMKDLLDVKELIIILIEMCCEDKGE